MIKLKKMTKKEYKTFIKKSIKRFAKEQIKSGYWTKEEALKEAKAQYKRNMGKGLKEPRLDFYTIRNKEDKKVGSLLLVKQKNILFMDEIYIQKKYRHQGYGTATLKRVEKIAKKLNYDKVGIQVFTHNKVAKILYDNEGFSSILEFRMKRI